MKYDVVGTICGYIGGIAGVLTLPLQETTTEPPNFTHFIYAAFLVPTIGAVVGFAVTRLLKKLFPEKKDRLKNTVPKDTIYA
jgi:phosphate/sulfate permease